MSTFNGARYLEPQLESFAAQTLNPDELVVCDDASSDATWDILRHFESVAPFPVRLHRTCRNLGVAKSFERGTGLADGDLIFFSDQDDVWFPGKLASIVAFFDQNRPALAVTCNQELTTSDLLPTGLTTFGQFRSGSRRGAPFAVGCCTAIRKSFRRVLLPIPAEIPAHDVWLHSLSEALNVRRCLPQTLQYHRRHGSNVSAEFLNPTSPVGTQQQIQSALSTDAYAACEWRKLMLDLVTARLESLLGSSDRANLARVDLSTCIARVQRERAALVRRQALLRRARRRRMTPALVMTVRGDYRYFSGWKSLAKDLCR